MNPSSTTTTTTTTTTQDDQSFDMAIENIGTAILESYTTDDSGAPVVLEEEQLASINSIVDSVKENAQAVFKPLYEKFRADLAQQEQTIQELTLKISALSSSSAVASAAPAAAPVMAPIGELPTVEWLQANRKSKKDTALTGYNAFTMWFMAKNKNGFPPKGVWETQDKKAYDAIAKAYNLIRATGGAGAAVAGAPGVAQAPIEIPTLKGKGKAVTAFNVFTQDYMAKNPGKGFPAKGEWAKVSKADVARYTAQAKAIQALRA